MNAEEMRYKIKQSIARVMGISQDQIADNASYADDLKLDSLSLMEVVVDLEFQFNIKIREEEIPMIRTVNDTFRLAEQKVSEQQLAPPSTVEA